MHDNRRWNLTLELAEQALYDLGIDDPLMETVLADKLQQTIKDFIDALDGDTDETEAMLDARDRADAIERER